MWRQWAHTAWWWNSWMTSNEWNIACTDSLVQATPSPNPHWRVLYHCVQYTMSCICIVWDLVLDNQDCQLLSDIIPKSWDPVYVDSLSVCHVWCNSDSLKDITGHIAALFGHTLKADLYHLRTCIFINMQCTLHTCMNFRASKSFRAQWWSTWCTHKTHDIVQITCDQKSQHWWAAADTIDPYWFQ